MLRRSRFLPSQLFAPVASPDPVPPLEPPAALAVRCHPQNLRRNWLHNRVREIPCWLLSTLTHIAAFILLALLVVPVGYEDVRQPLILLFPEDLGPDEEIATVETVILPRADDLPCEDPRPLHELPPIPDLIDMTGQSGLPIDVPRSEPRPEPPPPLDSPSAQAGLDPAALLVKVTVSGCGGCDSIPSLEVMGQVRDQTRPTGSVVTRINRLTSGSSHASAGEPARRSLSRQQMDTIVDRFILYDIGKLPGPAGVQAKHDFDQLGPDAIPALVDGLNRAAGVHQSCPVCVISQKLEQALKETDDPAMIAYALEHIGRGVPDNAPHAERVRGLKKRWLVDILFKREVIQSQLEDRGLPADDWMINRVHQLTLASREEVIAALHSQEPRTRLAAVVALETRARTGGPNGDATAARLLAERLDDPHPVVEGVARDNLVRLAKGTDLGRLPQDWIDYWDVVEQTRRMSGVVPQNLVEKLDHPEWAIRQAVVKIIEESADRLSATQRADLGQRLSGMLADGQPEVEQAAAQALIALAGGYELATAGADGDPDRSLAADRWRAYWQRFETELATQPRAESLFAMARTLEQHGRIAEAAERYRRIVDEYGDTTAAKRAQGRLDAFHLQ